jgi:hypothetical protein
MRLPRDNVAKTIVFDFREHIVELIGKVQIRKACLGGSLLLLLLFCKPGKIMVRVIDHGFARVLLSIPFAGHGSTACSFASWWLLLGWAILDNEPPR